MAIEEEAVMAVSRAPPRATRTRVFSIVNRSFGGRSIEASQAIQPRADRPRNVARSSNN
jgi:hypothetical protein